MSQLEYLTDQNGHKKAVVIPIDLWNRLFLTDDPLDEEISESIENYCLNKAMDEGKKSSLMNRKEALAWLVL